MAERTIHPQWRDANEASKYPFADTATLTSLTGVSIEEDTFLDAHLYPIGNTANLHISSIVVSAPNVTINIGTTTNSVICSVTFDLFSSTSVLSSASLIDYSLKFVDAYNSPAGVLVSDAIRLSRFRSWNEGTHSFLSEETEFCASVSTPTPEEGLRGMTTVTDDFIAGDIWLVGENGIVLRKVDTDTDNCHVIQVDAVGDPLFRRRLCEDKTLTLNDTKYNLFENKSYLRTINKIPPDLYGNYVISAGDTTTPSTALRIVSTPDGIKLKVVGQTST